MQANSNIKPSSLFEIEVWGDMSTIIFYPEFPDFNETVNEEGNTQYNFQMHRLTVPDREGLSNNIEANYHAWLKWAIEKENEAIPETDKEKIIRLEKENKQLGVDVSEREINEIIQGMEISDLGIRVLELEIGGI